MGYAVSLRDEKNDVHVVPQNDELSVDDRE